MKRKTNSIGLIAMSTALIAVLSQIVVPFGPVPFTLQTLGIGLISSLLNRKDSLFAIGLYLLLGGMGLPVFAGGTSGLGVLFGPTAGFLWGFIFYGLIAGHFVTVKSHIWEIIAWNSLSDVLVLLSGLAFFMVYTGTPFPAAFAMTCLPFLIPDFVKISMVGMIVPKVYKQLSQQAYFGK